MLEFTARSVNRPQLDSDLKSNLVSSLEHGGLASVRVRFAEPMSAYIDRKSTFVAF